MKKKILSIGLIMVLMVTLISLTGCGKNEDSDNKKDNEENVTSSKKVNAIEDNDSYFVIIDGTKFKAGDKISTVSKVGLKQKDKDLGEKIPKNRYLLASSVVNSDNKSVCKFVPLNSTDSTITGADAVIGGFEVGENNYDKISEETLALNIEVCGGIKLGSSYEDVKKVFGEADFKHETAADEKYNLPAYTTYKYSKGYKGYEFIVDDSGKISKIEWTNYNYNE